MKNPAICLLSVLMCFSALTAQPTLLPKLTLLTCEGAKVSANTILSEGRPMLIVYWNLSNKECYKQVDEFLYARDESLQNYNVKIAGIFVDNFGDWQELRPILNGKSWDIEVYIDVNAQLQRAMCIPTLPFIMLYDPKMSLVCSRIGYCSNMGDNLCKKVKSCLSDTH